MDTRYVTESSDEGISMVYEDGVIDELRREMADIRRQLEQERCLRAIIEGDRVKPSTAAPAPTYTTTITASPHPAEQQQLPCRPVYTTYKVEQPEVRFSAFRYVLARCERF